MTGTCLRVLVSLRLLNASYSKSSISKASPLSPAPPPYWRDVDEVHTTVIITMPTVQEDVGKLGGLRSATGLRPNITGQAQTLWFNYVKYACLPEEGAKRLLEKAMA